MLGFFVIVIWYTAYRLHAHFQSVPFWKFQIITAVCAVGSFAIAAITGRLSNPFVSVLTIISGYVLIFLIFSFIFFAISHLIMLKWKLPLVWSGAAVLAIAFIITSIGAVIGSFFIVRETEIKVHGLNNNLTIMQITDVHLGHHRQRNYLAKIVEETNTRNPDLVFITGDLVDAELALLPGILAPLSNFNAPVYFVKGNHEEYAGAESALKIINENNVRILHNEVIETHGLQLIGLDYMKADEDTFDMHPSDNPNTVKSVLADIPLKSDVPSILISHSPVGSQYANAAGIDLMLSGHTHGGQIFPFSLFAKISFPFNSGLYQQGNTKVFVSNGAGTYMIRVRLGSFNEINLLRLSPKR
jgi:predicted MPP superfamily phosphohydrolase